MFLIVLMDIKIEAHGWWFPVQWLCAAYNWQKQYNEKIIASSSGIDLSIYLLIEHKWARKTSHSETFLSNPEGCIFTHMYLHKPYQKVQLVICNDPGPFVCDLQP